MLQDVVADKSDPMQLFRVSTTLEYFFTDLHVMHTVVMYVHVGYTPSKYENLDTEGAARGVKIIIITDN